MRVLFKSARHDIIVSEDEPVLVRTPSYLQNLTQVFLSEPVTYVLHNGSHRHLHVHAATLYM